MIFALVGIAIGFFCVGYVWGYEKAFNQKLIHMQEIVDNLIKENSDLRFEMDSPSSREEQP